MPRKTLFKLKNNLEVYILIDDENYAIEATTLDGKSVGKFEFSEIEGPHEETWLKLIWAYLDFEGPEYLHQGLGSKCIEMALEYWGLPITSSENLGVQQDDGSHPTGDAPAFLNKLRQKKLIL